MSHHGRSFGVLQVGLAAAILVVLLVIGGLSAAQAQTGPQGIPQAVGTNFDSYFTSDHAGWKPVTGYWTVNANGYYRSPGKKNSTASVKHIDTYSDFNYEVRMKRKGAYCLGCGNGIVFRGDPSSLYGNWWRPSYVFEYFTDGTYDVIEINTISGAVPLKSRTASSWVNDGEAWNNLIVQVSGTSLEFYINAHLLWSTTNSYLSSGKVGVQFSRGDGPGILLIDQAHMDVVTSARILDMFADVFPAIGGT